MDPLERGRTVLDVAHAAAELGDAALRRVARDLAAPGGRRELTRLLRVFYHLSPSRRQALLDHLQPRGLGLRPPPRPL